MEQDFVYYELLVLEKLNNFLLDNDYNVRIQRIMDLARRAGISYRIGEHSEELSVAAAQEVRSLIVVAFRSCFFHMEDSTDETFGKARMLSYLCQEHGVPFTTEVKDSPLMRLIREKSIENFFNAGAAALARYIDECQGSRETPTLAVIKGKRKKRSQAGHSGDKE